jgi:hypothetical protein
LYNQSNVVVMIKKYRVSINFYFKIMIFGKTVVQHIWIWSENLIILKNYKNLYT